MATTPLLQVQDLVVRFRVEGGTVHAVNGVSFDVRAGETIGLVGESGSGKSATGLAILGLLPRPAGRVAGGRILFEGRDLTSLAESEFRRLRGTKLAMIFQDPSSSLNPVLRIEEQMGEGIRAHRRVSVATARKHSHELLGLVGIPEPSRILSAYPHQLSGGMRQRVMIAIALALEPALLVADEPTTALDVTIQAQVLELIQRLTDESGTAVILITHDLGIVAGMAHRVHVMYAGCFAEEAETRELFRHPSHPYTIGLLHSLPRVDQPVAGFRPIEGAPPSQRMPQVGCPFVPRCEWKIDVCETVMPPLEAETVPRPSAGEPSAAHRAACHNVPTEAEAEAGAPLRLVAADARGQ